MRGSAEISLNNVQAVYRQKTRCKYPKWYTLLQANYTIENVDR